MIGRSLPSVHRRGGEEFGARLGYKGGMSRLDHLRALLFPGLIALGSLGSGCRFDQSSAPPELDEAWVLGLEATRAWRVESGGEALGSVVRFRETTPPHRVLFAVRNVHDQDMGRIDAKGRAWRERPHREPEWAGTGTVANGVRLILGLSEEPELHELPLAALGMPGRAD